MWEWISQKTRTTPGLVEAHRARLAARVAAEVEPSRLREREHVVVEAVAVREVHRAPHGHARARRGRTPRSRWSRTARPGAGASNAAWGAVLQVDDAAPAVRRVARAVAAELGHGRAPLGRARLAADLHPAANDAARRSGHLRGGGGRGEEAERHGERASQNHRTTCPATRSFCRTAPPSRQLCCHEALSEDVPPRREAGAGLDPRHRRVPRSPAGRARELGEPQPLDASRGVEPGPDLVARLGVDAQGVERLLDPRGLERGQVPAAPHGFRAHDPVTGRPLEVEARRLLPVGALRGRRKDVLHLAREELARGARDPGHERRRRRPGEAARDLLAVVVVAHPRVAERPLGDGQREGQWARGRAAARTPVSHRSPFTSGRPGPGSGEPTG